MNKQYFEALAGFNHWADQKVIGWLDQINDEQWTQVVTSSFSSIEKTAIHLASAEKIWIDFWTNAPDPVYLSAEFKGTKNDLIAIWKKASAGLKYFMENHLQEDYQQPVSFIYPNGTVAQMEYWQTFAHIVNHSTYHRGQLVTMLRQVGFADFSSIDLITYYIYSSKNIFVSSETKEVITSMDLKG
ncbi:DinB family protein [Mucilaginibacter pineti]|nr:DinB family protein [Mucilaginibacter pineti]